MSICVNLNPLGQAWPTDEWKRGGNNDSTVINSPNWLKTDWLIGLIGMARHVNCLLTRAEGGRLWDRVGGCETAQPAAVSGSLIKYAADTLWPQSPLFMIRSYTFACVWGRLSTLLFFGEGSFETKQPMTCFCWQKLWNEDKRFTVFEDQGKPGFCCLTVITCQHCFNKCLV